MRPTRPAIRIVASPGAAATIPVIKIIVCAVAWGANCPTSKLNSGVIALVVAWTTSNDVSKAQIKRPPNWCKIGRNGGNVARLTAVTFSWTPPPGHDKDKRHQTTGSHERPPIANGISQQASQKWPHQCATDATSDQFT